jgi:hypothetical protein
MVVRLEEYRR